MFPVTSAQCLCERIELLSTSSQSRPPSVYFVPLLLFLPSLREKMKQSELFHLDNGFPLRAFMSACL